MKNLFKKILLFCLALVFVLLSSNIDSKADEIAKDEVTIQILATSDTHGKLLPFDYMANKELSGSMSRISTIVNKYKNNNTILIDVGDVLKGNYSNYFNASKSNPFAKALNLIGYDVFVTGNHEYNYGIDVLKNFLNQLDAKVLVGNVFSKKGKALASPYTIITRGDVKIGIIGMVTPNITRWDADNLKKYTIKNPVEETKKAIKELKGKVDIIIAATHMGEENEHGVADSGIIDLANKCPELDLIIAAHDHNQIFDKYYNNVLVVENKSDGDTLARINISLKKNSKGKYVITNKESESINSKDYPVDDSFNKEFIDYDKTLKNAGKKIIGKNKGADFVEPDEIEGIPSSLTKDNSLFNLLNEVLMYYSGSDVSAIALFENDLNLFSGNIRSNDISNIYDKNNTLLLLKMTGKQLKKYMEWSASIFNTYKPGDLTLSFKQDRKIYLFDGFSGLKYDINVSKEAGNRIENLKYSNGSPVKDDDSIYVSVNNYRANTVLLKYGDIFEEGEDLPIIVEKDIESNTIGGITELITDYITNVKNGKIKPMNLNNWKITGNNWDKEKHELVVKLVKEGILDTANYKDGTNKFCKPITESDIKQFYDPKINIRADYKSLNQKTTVSYSVESTAGVKSVKYLHGKIKDINNKKWESKAKDITNKYSFKVKKNGYYSILVEDLLGNKKIQQIKVNKELKAVWFAYYDYVDLYGSIAKTDKEFSKRMDEVFTKIENMGANAVIAHVRSHSDAMYNSKYYPWSKYASGTQGVNPGYDPLKIMIDLAHKHNLEFHAWLNPYRVTSGTTSVESLAKNNPARKWLEDENPDNDRNVLKLHGNLYYNPSSKDVQKLITNGVKEIIKNYDVDGIHFDDYFYPDLIGNDKDDYKKLFDAPEYEKYKQKQINKGKSYLDIVDWRRDNVNTLLEGIYKAIKNYDSTIDFGVSPGGFIDYLTMNNQHYVDYPTWLSENKYMDYICPQLYWTNDSSNKFPYNKTLDRWIDARSKNSNVSIYVGLAVYKTGLAKNPSNYIEDGWLDENVLKDMIIYGRNTKKVDGYFFFDYSDLISKSREKQVNKMIEELNK